MPEVPLTIPSGDVALEGALLLPDGDGPFATVVICHPHPQYGGSMDNNVVAAAASGLRARGLAAVLFNFRGVGGSGGIAGDRDEARADVAAVRAHASTLDALDAERIGLAGYSFGAGVAASCADAAIPALALIALPISMADEGRAALAAYPHPLLLLSGDQDQGSDAEGLRALASTTTGEVAVTIEPGADHFWWGHERAIADTVGDFFARALLD